MRRTLTALTATTSLLLALSACGGDADPAATRATQDDSPPAASSTAPGGGSGAGSGAGTGSVAAPSSSASGATGTTTTGGTGTVTAGSTTTGQSGATAAPRRTSAAVPQSAGEPAAEDATKPGDYLYDSTGTVTVGVTPQPVDGTATLTVDPQVGGAQHSVLKGDQGQTEQDVLVREGGSFLTRLQITNAAFDKTFEPDPAVLLVPSPATVGKTWSWTAKSTDGKTTVKQSSKIVRSETLTIGGTRVPCQVVQTTLTLTGDITYDGEITSWYSESLHLAVKERNKGRGTASGFMFSTDVTSTARSTQPA